MELQRLDYTELSSSDREIQQAADRQLYTALSQLGFAKITNHPIARPVVEDLFSWVSGSNLMKHEQPQLWGPSSL